MTTMLERTTFVNRKKIVCLLLVFVLILSACQKNEPVETVDEVPDKKVEHTLNDFADLHHLMTMDEVIQRYGEPNEKIQKDTPLSSIDVVYFIYYLKDGNRLRIDFNHSKVMFPELLDENNLYPSSQQPVYDAIPGFEVYKTQFYIENLEEFPEADHRTFAFFFAYKKDNDGIYMAVGQQKVFYFPWKHSEDATIKLYLTEFGGNYGTGSLVVNFVETFNGKEYVTQAHQLKYETLNYSKHIIYENYAPGFTRFGDEMTIWGSTKKPFRDVHFLARFLDEEAIW